MCPTWSVFERLELHKTKYQKDEKTDRCTDTFAAMKVCALHGTSWRVLSLTKPTIKQPKIKSLYRHLCSDEGSCLAWSVLEIKKTKNPHPPNLPIKLCLVLSVVCKHRCLDAMSQISSCGFGRAAPRRLSSNIWTLWPSLCCEPCALNCRTRLAHLTHLA